MANDVTSNPIVLDAATANHAAMSLPNDLPLEVLKVEWFKPTTAGHTFTIKHWGKNWLEGECETNGISQSWNFDPPFKLGANSAWYLSQISSGKIYIWFK